MATDKCGPFHVEGQIWRKKATIKTSVNAPRIKITLVIPGLKTVDAKPLNFRLGNGWTRRHWTQLGSSSGVRTIGIDILERDWELL